MSEVRTCKWCDAQAYAGHGVINQRTIEITDADDNLVDSFEAVCCDSCYERVRDLDRRTGNSEIPIRH